MLLRRLKYRLFLKSKFEFVVISHNPRGTRKALLSLLGIRDVLTSDHYFPTEYKMPESFSCVLTPTE